MINLPACSHQRRTPHSYWESLQFGIHILLVLIDEDGSRRSDLPLKHGKLYIPLTHEV